MTEYCFLWIDWWATCMNKSEWASWAQVVGVLVATLVALIFPLLEAKRSRDEKKKDYVNDRFALNEFKDDVINFVGPLTNFTKEGGDLMIDEIQYGRILERISYFDVRLRDSSAKKLLALIRTLLRSLENYRLHVDQRIKHGHDGLMNNFKRLCYSKFKPEDESYFFVRGEVSEPDKEVNATSISWLNRNLLRTRSIFRINRKAP